MHLRSSRNCILSFLPLLPQNYNDLIKQIKHFNKREKCDANPQIQGSPKVSQQSGQIQGGKWFPFEDLFPLSKKVYWLSIYFLFEISLLQIVLLLAFFIKEQ